LRNAAGGSDELHSAGHLASATVFLSAPWGTPDLVAGVPSFERVIMSMAEEQIAKRLGVIPVEFRTTTSAILGASRHVLPHDSYIVSFITGEMTELFLITDGVANAYATLPMGRHFALRTLRAHGTSAEEARSLMRLGTDHEPLAAAAAQYSGEVSNSLERLLKQGHTNRLYVVAHEGGEWFAHTLSQSPDVADLFPHGGEVRALKPSHVAPFIAAHAEEPDLLLSLQALVL